MWSGPLFADENVNSIFIHGADTILVGLSYVDTVPYLVVRSTDAGLHWLDLDFNFDNASFNVYNIYALEETAQGLVIAGTDSGLYVFQSSDSTWQSFGGTNVPDSIIVNSFTPLANGIIMGTYGSGVYRYSYTGSSWQQIGMPAVVNTLATYGNGNVFAGINGGVYNSSDLGATWESGGLLGTTVLALAISSTGVLYAGMDVSDGGLWESPDKGSTWIWDTTLGSYSVQCLIAGPNGTMYAGTGAYYDGEPDPGIFQSTESIVTKTGMTWKNLGLSNHSINVIVKDGTNNLYAGTDAGVYISSNNGEEWNSPALAGFDIFSNALSIDSNGFVFAGTNGDGLWSTSDNGGHWHQMDSSQQDIYCL